MIMRYLCLLLAGIGVLLGISCSTQPQVQETPLPINKPLATEAPARLPDRGIGDDIRSLTEEGIPSSLLRALDLIRTRDLGDNEFGRIMTAVILNLLHKFYPYPPLPAQVPVLPQSQTHIYSRILRNGETGVYTAPRQNTQDYLELVLPFLTFSSHFAAYQPERLLDALPDLRRAEALNPRSVLAPYFIGLIYEHTNRPNRAIQAYTRAYGLSAECYPAALGQARILEATGQRQEAILLLEKLLIQSPDNMTVKHQLARTYYAGQDWPRAESAIAEILQQDSQNPEFILMYAHALVEQGQFFKALVPLDRYSNKNQRLYLFLRAKVQAEGYLNRGAALNYLRAILKASPTDEQVAVYTAALLLQSPRWEEQNEGRELLQSLLQAEQPSLEVIDLVFKDAVQREDWEEASRYVDKLLGEHRYQYLLSASRVEQGLGNTGKAFAYAQEFHEQNPADEAGAMVYAAALINTGRQREAKTLIESRLKLTEKGTERAEYYYLHSRIGVTEEEVVQDLRSSLFEDPRNLHSLIAMVELYHRRKDQRRVIYYLKQALSFAPEHARLHVYEQEYLR
ncbi:MAG: tetratricopeptide repeat protein [Treponema sp.]|jgi:predicted Zn-dependent protease|nr:tetratricopeptide repeat protein [Treponema sp.]